MLTKQQFSFFVRHTNAEIIDAVAQGSVELVGLQERIRTLSEEELRCIIESTYETHVRTAIERSVSQILKGNLYKAATISSQESSSVTSKNTE